MARKKPDIPIPTIEQVEAYMGRLKVLENDVIILKAQSDNLIARLKERYKIKIDALKYLIKPLVKNIYRYLDAHRSDFRPPGKRSIKLLHGVIGWHKIRDDKFIVSPKNNSVACCEALGLDHLINTTKTVNLKALALHLKGHPDDIDKIDGIRRPDQDEECFYEIIHDGESEAI